MDSASVNNPAENVTNTPQVSFGDQLPNPAIKKFRAKHILLVLFTCLFIFGGAGYYYFFSLVPKAQAEEYIKNASENFKIILDKVNALSNDFNALTSSYTKSQESFDEISKSVTFENAVVDTKQDIEDINQTLEIISTIQNNNNAFNIPDELSPLNDKLNEYYQNSTQALQTLLTHQNFQLQMLDSYGYELAEELKKAETLATTESARLDLISTYKNVATLSGQVETKFKKISDIPELELTYYQIRLGSLVDIKITFSSMSAQLEQASTEGDSNYLTLLTEFSERNSKREKDLTDFSKSYKENSDITRLFRANDELVKQIIVDFENLSEQYDVNIEDALEPIITPAISPPQIHSTPTPTQESTIDPNTDTTGTTSATPDISL